MLEATDKVDSAQLTLKDVTQPEGWILLAFTIDPRSGFGPEFQKYFRWLVEYVKEVSLDRVLNHREVKRRTDRFLAEQEAFTNILNQNSHLDGSVIITDLRGLDMTTVPVGNRFLVYTMYLEAHSEVRIFDGKMDNTVVAAGHSIFNKSCSINIGELMDSYGGGGHFGAGTCQIPPDAAENVIKEIIDTLNG
jgi:nanoRNase/pAp phosphatase (c-di-AMP/oligoRNAs hydrolase)